MQNIRKVGGGAAIPQSGLSLWLKADAGLTTTPEQFISQVVISGGGRSAMNGTYTRAIGGETSFVKTGDSNFVINWTGAEWYINGDEYYCESDNSNQTEYAYNPSYDMSSNWLISPDFGCDGTPPTGSLTLSPTGTLLVTAWADQSGNGCNATPLTASPTLTTINSKSFVSFNGVDQALVGANVISALPCTIISVLQVASYLGEDLWFEQYDETDYIGLYANGDSFGWTAYNGAPFESTDSPWPTNTTQLATTIFDGANSAHFHNGSLAGTGDSGDRTPAGSYYLSYFVPVSSYKNYKIAEIIVYNLALTTPQRQQVEAYLNTKYAIY